MNLINPEGFALLILGLFLYTWMLLSVMDLIVVRRLFGWGYVNKWSAATNIAVPASFLWLTLCAAVF